MTKTAQQVEALFDAARQLASPAARRTFLDQACADDATLRARVEALLSAQADADKFFSEIAPFASTPPPGTGEFGRRARLPRVPESRREESGPTEGPGQPH